MLYPIIMAGGSGTRLWPISRRQKPKQIYPFLGKESLLQATWRRLRKGFPAKYIYLTTTHSLKDEILKQLKELNQENLVIEPMARGTAAALGLALLKLQTRAPKAIFVYINVDNFIEDEREFLRVLKVAEKVVKLRPYQVVLIGVNPTYPETGYGYIKIGSPIMKLRVRKSKNQKAGKPSPQFDEIFKVEEFVEKPDLETAKRYLASWQYLWNPTLIVSRVDHFLSLYRKHLPEMWQVLFRIKKTIERDKDKIVPEKEYKTIKPISVDYGILEKEKDLLVLPANFGWSDVGHWLAIDGILRNQIFPGSCLRKRKSFFGNICRGGKTIAVNSENNFIYSLTGKLIALVGVKDFILIETDDAILFCHKAKAQEVREIVSELEKRKMKKYL
jgi:mannose-1-phosphate guanylyltransferase